MALLDYFGVLSGVSHTILGLTVLAWGNSVGDLSTDVAMARKALSHIIIVNDSNNNDNNNNKKGQLGRRPLHRRRHGPQGAFSYYYC